MESKETTVTLLAIASLETVTYRDGQTITLGVMPDWVKSRALEISAKAREDLSRKIYDVVNSRISQTVKITFAMRRSFVAEFPEDTASVCAATFYGREQIEDELESMGLEVHEISLDSVVTRTL